MLSDSNGEASLYDHDCSYESVCDHCYECFDACAHALHRDVAAVIKRTWPLSTLVSLYLCRVSFFCFAKEHSLDLGE